MITRRKKPDDNGDSVAVVFANGAIMDGPETPGNVGGDTTAAELRDARLDPKVKAIVFRVNSPGGSVSASEVIRAELAAARAAGKPVVVSMGGMAASGGYWISTPANYIVANPSTLTGSIGIFGVINTVRENPGFSGRAYRRRGDLAAGGCCGDQSTAAGVLGDDAAQH